MADDVQVNAGQAGAGGDRRQVFDSYGRLSHRTTRFDTYPTIEDIDNDQRHIELYDTHSLSWARVRMARGEHPWRIISFSPRRQWDQADDAYTWWTLRLLLAGRTRRRRWGA